MAWSRVLPLLLLAACAAQTDDDGAASGESDLTAFDKAMPDVDAISYDVDLSITNAAKSHEAFAITAKATFIATRHLATLDLDFDGHSIDSVQVDGQPAQYTRHGTTLTITLPRAVDAGASVKTTIAYHGDVFQADGNPRTDFEHFGGFYVQHAAGGTIFTSLGWPSSTRKWIPVRDHPRDGAIITMRATFPGDLTVIANGKQKSSTPNADGTRTWSFSSEKPIPIYDLHLSASNRWLERTQHAPQSNVAVRALTYKEHTRIADQVYAGDAQAAAVDYYSKTFGTYGWTDELRYLEEPIFSGGMENASAISLDDSLFTRIDVAETRRTTFHELAHHWSGNLVRYRTWNDFWLSEGFTEYLTRRFVEDHDGLAAGKALWRTTVQAGLDAEASDLHPVRPADPEKSVLTFFDDVVYEKGAVVLRMIEEQVGRDAFTAFMKSWFAKHAYTAMGTDDFVKELSAATNQDWKPFFQQWVYGVSHPTLKASTTRTDASHVKVTLEQTQSGSAFTLPVDVALGSKVVTIAMTAKTATADVELATDPTSITVDPNEQLFIERSCTTNACPTGMHCSSRKVCQ